uniref:GBD/FH3 domain-containing protein n=1 Tax=Macrostomum lignano TaxID=282301 RepID=A0A1I8JB19_9PLAT
MAVSEDSLTFLAQYLDDSDPFAFNNSFEPKVGKPYIFSLYSPLSQLLHELYHMLNCPLQLEDCTLQLLKFNGSQGDYGPYLDLELSIEEQWYNFDSFGQDKRDALIIRTQLSIRVRAIVEKLLSSSGVELSRILSSLKQIFQDDKDLVHEFVESGGLDAIVTIGHQCEEANHYHILRALGQIMLYIDGMTGIGKHKATVEWLYSLLSSKHRNSVVKNAAKLLVIFVEYAPGNGELFMKAVSAVSVRERQPQWSHVMSLLKDTSLTEEIYYVLALKLVNSCLAYLPDQEAYYDLVDILEEQGMMQALLTLQPRAKQCEELQQQIDLYETTLKLEDGEIMPSELSPSSNLLPTLRRNKRGAAGSAGTGDKRQSRRRSVHDVAMTTNAAAATAAAANSKSKEPETAGSPLVTDKRARSGGEAATAAAAPGGASTALSATKKGSDLVLTSFQLLAY